MHAWSLLSAKLVDTETPEVRGAVNTGQMEQIPTDRGFLDLTRLEPGVQLLDGQVLAPSKSGLTAASVVGRNGRTTRMQVDGLDITDEAVGATTTNIPVGAIQEVEVEQSLLPLSSGLASAGTVNVITKSGANDLHGQLFGNFRDKAAGGASFPGRSRTIPTRAKFSAATLAAPGRKTNSSTFCRENISSRTSTPRPSSTPPSMFWMEAIKLPFTRPKLRPASITNSLRRSQVFYRFTYDNGSDVNAFGGSNFQPLKSRDNTYGNAGWLRFHPRTVSPQHSLCLRPLLQQHRGRGGGSNIFNPAPGISLNFAGGSGFASGPNPQAPQKTKQANIRRPVTTAPGPGGDHTFRFGVAVNKINNLISADLFGLAPQVGSDTGAARSCSPESGLLPAAPAIH